MPTVAENRRFWGDVYDWSQGGEEWSLGWGGTHQLWEASLLPRVARFLPAPVILELAPGYGRFTPYLSAHCQTYIGVDISPGCVQACQQRFPEHQFFCNDGESLPMIADGSVDFIFSFFSLIHAEEETMLAYLREFARVLKPGGGGFVHHSNLAEHGAYFRAIGRLPRWAGRLLFGIGLVDLPQWRASSVSAEVFARCARQTGLALVTQETVNFGSRRTIDAFSSFVRADGPWQAPGQLWRHPGFMHEAMRVRLRGRPSHLPDPYYRPLQPKSSLGS
jgi:ubiquinone/menaquinone biosynthesis C-methylase UbiE